VLIPELLAEELHSLFVLGGLGTWWFLNCWQT
jgi:hypothetical protein